MMNTEKFLLVIRKSDRGSNHTSATRKVLTIMQAGLAIRKYYSGFQGSRKNFVFNDTYRNQRLPKANLWIIKGNLHSYYRISLNRIKLC